MTALLFPAIAGLLLFVLAVAWVRHSPTVGLALLCLILIPLWEVPYPPPIAELAGLSIYPSDAIVLVLFGVGVLEVTQIRANLRGWIVPWVLFGALIAVSLLLGVAAFGSGVAINEARTILYFFSAMTWVLAVRPDRLRLFTFSLVLGWALALVAAYHGVVYGIGGASSSTVAGDNVRNGRILIASQSIALLLCAATVFLSPADWSRGRRHLAITSAAVFLGVVVLGQHRSVWSACAAGTAAIFLYPQARQSRKGVLVGSVVGAWLVLVSWVSGFLESNLVQSASDFRTYDWRSSSWQALISEAIARGPATVLAGDPFGGGYLRQIARGVWTTASAHNWYVLIFLRLGIIGLIVLATVLVPAFLKSRDVSALWTFVIAAVAVYGWAYTVDWYLAPWLGAAIIGSLGGGRVAEHPVLKPIPSHYKQPSQMVVTK